MQSANDAEVLFQFFGGTFHQDWSFDFPTWKGAVHDFVQRSGSAGSKAVQEALSRLLSEDWSDEELEEKIKSEYHGYESPGLTGQSARVWLTQVAEEIRTASEQVG